jgi:multidrug efflux pump subunit AcrA (membrane-fusion protein)
MNKHIKTLHHHPRRVIAISLVIALAIGAYGYSKINQKPAHPFTENTTTNVPDTTTNQNLTLGFLSVGRIKTVSVKAGDVVKKGQILATLDAGNVVGALTEAKAAYAVAESNYQKVINGATSAAIDVAKAQVNTAQVNLSGITKQQNVLVGSAHLNLLNSTLIAKSQADSNTTLPAPIISGTYTKNIEGTIIISIIQDGTGGYFNISGLVTGTGTTSTTTPQSILDTGMSIEFPTGSSYAGTTWQISIPNTNAPNYLANYNAYQSALENQNQAINSAQAMLDQANASLTALATAARPEDVRVAQAQVDIALGAVQIAQATYDNTIITAPENGTVVSVNITPGQIAIANAPAIEFTIKNK